MFLIEANDSRKPKKFACIKSSLISCSVVKIPLIQSPQNCLQISGWVGNLCVYFHASNLTGSPPLPVIAQMNSELVNLAHESQKIPLIKTCWSKENWTAMCLTDDFTTKETQWQIEPWAWILLLNYPVITIGNGFYFSFSFICLPLNE